MHSDAAQSVDRTLAESWRPTADAPPIAVCGDLPIDWLSAFTLSFVSSIVAWEAAVCFT